MSIYEIILSIVSTIVGIIGGGYFSRFLEMSYLPKITAARRIALSGKWKGMYLQEKNEKRAKQNIPVEVTLNAGSRRVTGIMQLKDGSDFQFDVEGSFSHDMYLRLNYSASGATKDAIDFGVIFIKLGQFPNKMTGKLAGSGSISETLISGSVELTKCGDSSNGDG